MASLPPPPPPEDQARLLEEALGVVRQQTVQMRRCLETPGKLMDALKCSSTLVSELRTGSLGPKQYYELYMAVFDALRHLSIYLRDSHPTNHLADLYELVQYAGNVVPRLYLMITVGTVYMGIEDAPVKEIMKDMMEMSRGVQHPVRGLFLRYYLSGQARDHVPTGSGDGPQGNLQDSTNFVLTNFVEMNKLWVRLQHQGPSRERDLRTKERQELQLLVGSNLVRLSQLVDLQSYKNSILQPLLEQVVQCRDVLAQEYLLEVITQVFPDEYHLHTLDQFLSATAKLNPNVNVKSIVIGLMDRLSAYATREAEPRSAEDKQKLENEAVSALEKLKLKNEAKSETAEDDKAETDKTDVPEADKSSETVDGAVTSDGEGAKGIPENVKLFEIFYDQIVQVVTIQQLPIQDITALLLSLMNLAISIYPERLDYVDQVLRHASNEVSRFQNSADMHSQPAQANLLGLLQAPIKAYCSLFTALALPHFVPLYQQQTYPTRRAVAGEVARTLLRTETKITTPEQLEGVLKILSVLIKEGMQTPSSYSGAIRRAAVETDEMIEEQGWLARMVHLLGASDNSTQFELLKLTRTEFSEGNERTRYTSPALITACLKLARRMHVQKDTSTDASQLWKFAHSILTSLYSRVAIPGVPDLVLRLFISCGQVSSHCMNEDVAYESFAQAFTIYEESISDSRSQYQAICAIAGALMGCSSRFSRDNYDTLITKTALHGSKLLKKPDQCRAVYLASHLWWTSDVIDSEPPSESESETKAEGSDDQKETSKPQTYRDGKRVLECLQRALRVADACMDTSVSVELFIEILNRYAYYYEQENEAVTSKYLSGLIELIESNLATAASAGNTPSSGLDNAKKHFERTLSFMRKRGFEGVGVGV
ncbi:vacuolar protein sorting-associated protein 35 [Piedraia hortae CBS 480.64]|uniref:Vacuolar protein sorting-associated protein 35 n=1 Tax=Piedraia hortae CBS 480.64 TaxID=1314780 RepID=A0A6A7BXT1_9PEZI|nr:vacuolar protein sorting-associated protein 35 [Piedraia hortae CBS 480.64]